MPFRCSINTILCIEILSQITYFLIMELSSLEILDFVKVWKMQIWLKLCLGRRFIWLLRFLEGKYIVPRLIFGLWVSYSIRFYTAFALSNRRLFLNWYMFWDKLNYSFPLLLISVNKQKNCLRDSWPKIQQKGLNGCNF